MKKVEGKGEKTWKVVGKSKLTGKWVYSPRATKRSKISGRKIDLAVSKISERRKEFESSKDNASGR